MAEARQEPVAERERASARRAEPTDRYEISRGLFVRGLGLVYACAFLSLGVQLPGLVGSDGILPATRFVEALVQYPDSSFLHPAPTLFWFGSGDAVLRAAWLAGTGAAVLAMLGLVPAPALAVAWVLYRSLATVGQDFLGFQWDGLLLEAGFLGVLFAPWTLRLGGAATPDAPRIARWLVWWLAFRLFFFSGFVKLASDDPTWWGLTALSYHWWTQPLPLPASWYAAQAPALLDRAAVLATFAIELGLPWLLPFGRIPRLVAAAGFTLLMFAIAATGNYGFFNLLALVICLPLVDDATWRRLLGRPAPDRAAVHAPAIVHRAAVAVAAVFLVATSVPVSLAQARLVRHLPDAVTDLYDVAGRFQLVNTYGLFARMTTDRPEIVLEGTADGATWLPYEFRYKPGALDRAPVFAGPHMPRLDWQMWFAALGPAERSPWLYAFVRHLLLGTPDVLALLDGNPFPGAPPLAVRAVFYHYRFTDAAERTTSGDWWRRERSGEFLRPMSLSTRGGEIRP